MGDKPVKGVGENDEDGARGRFLRRLRDSAASSGPLNVAQRHAKALGEDDPNCGFADEVAVISLGNRLEAHGPALAPDIDDRMGAMVALHVCQHSGARYLGHSPYCTDGVGDLAAAWSPAYLPWNTFIAKTQTFVEQLLNAFYPTRRPRLLAFISGHGGNAPLNEACAELAQALAVERCCYYLALRQPPAAPPAQHAADLEHAMALQLGPACIDEQKLTALAQPRNQSATLSLMQRYPALGGMAGYYVFGDEPFDAIRRRYPGVKQSVADFVDRGSIVASRALGQRVLSHSVKSIADELLAEAEALAIRLPRFAQPADSIRG